MRCVEVHIGSGLLAAMGGKKKKGAGKAPANPTVEAELAHHGGERAEPESAHAACEGARGDGTDGTDGGAADLVLGGGPAGEPDAEVRAGPRSRGPLFRAPLPPSHGVVC